MLKNVFVGYSKKEIQLLFALLFLILVLPLTVFLVKTVQDLRSRAKVAGGPAKFYLLGPSSVAPGTSFDVDLIINPGGKEVSGFEAYLSYPTDKLDVESITINNEVFPHEFKKTSGAGNIDIAAGIAILSTPSPTPTNPAATLTPTRTPTPTGIAQGVIHGIITLNSNDHLYNAPVVTIKTLKNPASCPEGGDFLKAASLNYEEHCTPPTNCSQDIEYYAEDLDLGKKYIVDVRIRTESGSFVTSSRTRDCSTSPACQYDYECQETASATQNFSITIPR